MNEDYIEANHGVDDKSLDLLEGQYEVSAGSNKEYKALITYIENNSLVNNNNYNHVSSKMDIDEYINYMIVQIYGGNIDWPYTNIKYWREQSTTGKWRWMLFDTDRAFEDYERDSFSLVLDPNGAVEPNPPWSTFLFRSLMKNATFKQKFISTFNTHLNDTFQPNRISGIINNMKNTIEPEIQRHFDKWPRRSDTDWELGISDSIAELHEFALMRTNSIRVLMAEYFN
jgi:hypothetical protein